ncbi:ABC transporter substrate-binding protein/permease [Marinilactibacillus psychrotolerans]|uniref:Amino acid ABC transporter substrate-binding and permease protein n=1 Tax=Marinilactibacillus psychrotolerans TaxID=191770 RepID=A0AAV3WVJ7_9LACT|nr:ABC transporter substrate-binding protein/permease [Marinilactibacillus psychrotolerans]GEL67491.1 ABC transporter permease [Marinilactibacillus psychrotolerans]GEQ35652.1 amino acid ABC transporter substrate-binding and permease protein [Marinilactibacillus psychrotolerans]SDC72201.1 polar amino acid transport system substrate-binding protein [Marinilactibacillus psychrotolerans]
MKKYIKGFIAFFVLIVMLFIPEHIAYAEDGALEQVKENGELVIGTSADFPPFEFYAGEGDEQEIVGMDILIAEKIADDLGVELVIQDMGFDSLLPALESNKIDMIVAGMTPTEERRKSVNFSDIYFQTFQNIMVRSGDKDIYDSIESLAGQTIGVQSGTLQEELAQQIPNAKITKLENINDLILSLETNRIEAIVMQGPNAVAHAENNDELYTYEGDFELDEQDQGSAIAIRYGEDSLVEAVNESLAEISGNNLTEDYLATAGEYMSQDKEGGFVSKYWRYFLDGTAMTIFISLIGVLVGLVLGFILSLMRLAKNVIIRFLGSSYVEFVRGTPLLIQVMFIYFGVGVFFNLPALTAGIIAVSLNSGAYICEIIRSGLNSVDSGQSEAARSLGMSRNQAMRHIIFPQALKNIWPALGNEFITIIKESSIVSVIGVGELIFQTRVVRSASFEGILPLIITMMIYFVLTFTLTKILNYFEGRMNHD